MSLCLLLGSSLQAASKDTCIKTWHIERHSNPWKGLTNSAADEERSELIHTTTNGATAQNLIKPIAEMRGSDGYIFMRLPADKSVTVNAKWFSDLVRQDATGRPLINSGKIGSATATALKRFQPVELLSLLLQYQVILTYAHIESELCLVSAKTDGSRWIAHVTGRHTYYTSKRHDAALAFHFVLDTKTGEMSVAMLEASAESGF